MSQEHAPASHRIARIKSKPPAGRVADRRRPIRKRSATRLFGLPLWEIAKGADLGNGERRGHARAIIALGDVADGVVAVGGIARGVVAIGGISAGICSLGGIAIGLATAVGGVALAPFAIGGVVLGIVTRGGARMGYRQGRLQRLPCRDSPLRHSIRKARRLGT